MESQRLGNQDASSRTKIRKYRHIDLFFLFIVLHLITKSPVLCDKSLSNACHAGYSRSTTHSRRSQYSLLKISRVKGLFVSIQPFSYKYYLVLRKI